MKVMITGGNGFLGQHLCRFLRGSYTVIATGRGEKRVPFADVQYFDADITNKERLQSIVADIQPEVIIHTAAMSKPDECELNKELCNRINITGTADLIEVAKCMKQQPHFIYISSDFVLGNGGPHDENAIPAPLNYYGQSKLSAEKAVEQSGLFYTTVRPVFMYGETWNGIRPTFLDWVKQSLEQGKSIKVVSDQLRTPGYIVDICKGINAIIEKRAGGLYHLGGADRLSPFDMSVQLAELSGRNTSLIEPVTAETFKEPVQRAKTGGLLISKARKDLGYSPVSFIEGLKLSGFGGLKCT